MRKHKKKLITPSTPFLVLPSVKEDVVTKTRRSNSLQNLDSVNEDAADPKDLAKLRETLRDLVPTGSRLSNVGTEPSELLASENGRVPDPEDEQSHRLTAERHQELINTLNVSSTLI